MTDDHGRKELFNAWSDKYGQDVLDEESFPFIGYQAVLAAIVAMGKFCTQHRVLDLGIGTGNLAKLVPVPAGQICGVDFSENMLEMASDALPGSVLVQVDLQTDVWLDTVKGPFDRIISAYTFHEFPDDDKQKLIDRLRNRYLNKDGLILIGDISFADKQAFTHGRQLFDSKWDEEEYYWCAEPATKAFENEGFSVKYEQVSICAGVYLLKSQLEE